MRQTTDHKLRKILTDVLGLKPGQADGFTADTGLFGHLPELDSMAVAGLLTEMEDRLDIVVEDDEIVPAAMHLGKARAHSAHIGGPDPEHHPAPLAP